MFNADAFRLCCRIVLPLVYDESLSYYEVLAKLTQKINELVEMNKEIPDAIAELGGDIAQLTLAVEEIREGLEATNGKFEDYYTIERAEEVFVLKQNPNDGEPYVYGINSRGQEVLWKVKSTIIGDTIAQRTSGGQLAVAEPREDYHCATRGSSDKRYPMKTETPNIVYGTDGEGVQKNRPVTVNPENGAVVERMPDGNIMLPDAEPASGNMAMSVSHGNNKFVAKTGVAKRVYVTDNSGSNETLDYGSAATPDAMVQRDSTGNVLIPVDENRPINAAMSQANGDNRYVTIKKNIQQGIYGRRHGEEIVWTPTSSIAPDVIPMRDSNGRIYVPVAPADGDNRDLTAASVGYVDRELAKRVDKTTAVHSVYATDGSANNITIPYSSSAANNSVACRKSNGQLAVKETPIDDTDATSKKYVDDGNARKVDKDTTPNRLYGTNSTGAPLMYEFDADEPSAHSIVRRDANGHIKTAEPVDNDDAVTLNYFNTHGGSGGGSGDVTKSMLARLFRVVNAQGNVYTGDVGDNVQEYSIDVVIEPEEDDTPVNFGDMATGSLLVSFAGVYHNILIPFLPVRGAGSYYTTYYYDRNGGYLFRVEINIMGAPLTDGYGLSVFVGFYGDFTNDRPSISAANFTYKYGTVSVDTINAISTMSLDDENTVQYVKENTYINPIFE